MKKILILLFCFILTVTMLGGCGSKDDGGTSVITSDFEQTDADMFTDRDLDESYDEDSSISIKLNGTSATASSNSVKINGSTITITEESTYIIEGTLTDGMIIVNAGEKDKLQIVLNGAYINSENSAALYIIEGDKVFVTLAAGTENTLSNGGSFTAIDDNNIDAAVFSKQDVTFNGQGSLTVISPAGHGIVSKDDLVITGGTHVINSSSHGLDANDSIRIKDADIAIDAGKDGVHAENSDDESLGFVYISGGTFDVEAEGDGLSASAYMQINDGNFEIITGGGSDNASKQTSDSWGGFMGGGPGGNMSGGHGDAHAMSAATISDESDDSSTSIKGMKSASGILINGGQLDIDSADDAVHSNASITVKAGDFNIASGDDAFHADDTLTISGGTINVTESYEGLEGLHVIVAGGDIDIVASDDGLNAAGGTDDSGNGGHRGGDQFGGMGGSSSDGSIEISGGTLFVNASGDGIDANGTLTVSGGYTVVCGPTQGDTATLDYDISAVITGGTFIGTGASGMAQTFSDSKQGVIAVSVGAASAGTQITLTDSKGSEVISCTPELSYNVVILSSPEIVSGETYTITVGSASGSFEAS